MLVFYNDVSDCLHIYYYDKQNRLTLTVERPTNKEWTTYLSVYKDFDDVIAQSNSTLIHREDV